MDYPPIGFMKLNLDGSFLKGANLMGGGSLLRDSSGEWSCGFYSHEVRGCAFATEAMALRDGLAMAWRNDTRQLICESDCNDLIEVVMKRAQITHHAQAGILQKVFELVDRCWRVELYWVPREVNCAADWLAKQGACMRNRGFQQVEFPSLELEALLLQDKLRVP